MNFQNIPKIEEGQMMIDVAFKGAKASSKAKKVQGTDKIKNTRNDCIARIDVVKNIIEGRLQKVIDYFPIVDNLSDFYKELMLNSIDFDDYKTALKSLKWCRQKTIMLFKEYKDQLCNTNTTDLMDKIKHGYYGRISAILNKNNKYLINLDSYRTIMRSFPDIKDNVLTIAIAGFPNVGKSSLLKILTGSRPEIADYAFTTKSLNVGYLKSSRGKIQFVDAPGALNRDKMNPIEKMALVLLEHAADKIIIVLDPSESCGFELKKQIQFLEDIQKFNKEIFVIINKIDLLTDVQLSEITLKYKGAIPVSILKEKGIDNVKEAISNSLQKEQPLKTIEKEPTEEEILKE